MQVGQTVILVGPGGECEALVLDIVVDQESTVPRNATNLAYCSTDTSDVTPFGRAIRTLKSVPHESCKDVGPLRGGEFWRERGGAN